MLLFDAKTQKPLSGEIFTAYILDSTRAQASDGTLLLSMTHAEFMRRKAESSAGAGGPNQSRRGVEYNAIPLEDFERDWTFQDSVFVKSGSNFHLVVKAISSQEWKAVAAVVMWQRGLAKARAELARIRSGAKPNGARRRPRA